MELQCCYTTLESISCLRGYCYHFRAAAPLPAEETERGMYIKVVSLHSEASVCRERGEGERGKGGERERESVCMCVYIRGEIRLSQLLC